jgi:hypothetical protein
MIHNYGAKANRDRAMLVSSYHEMVRMFRTPKDQRLTPSDMARLSNTELFKAANALYTVASPKLQRAFMDRIRRTNDIGALAKIQNAVNGILMRLFGRKHDKARAA